MRARWMKRWWLMAGALLTSVILAAGQTTPAANSAALDVMHSSAPASATIESGQSPAGLHLTASFTSLCASAMQVEVTCQQPFVGEFVITEPNGEEVARVDTTQDGQATVDLPPGKYLLGVRTEEIYPLAAPVTVNILAGRYVNVQVRLAVRLQQQPQSH